MLTNHTQHLPPPRCIDLGDRSSTCTPSARQRRHGSEKPNRVRVGFLFSCSRCGGKRTYSDRKTARRAARIYHCDDKLSAYKCPYAPGLWHIGHSTSRLRDHYRRSV